MPSTNPVATSVTIVKNSVTIEFADGHRVVFESFDDVFSRQTEGLRHFWLYKNKQIVVQYRGQMTTRTRHLGPSDNEHRFVQVTKRYTREHIVRYWQAAVNFAEDKYTDEILAVPRDKMPRPPHPTYALYYVTQASLQDLRYIKDKLVLLPDEE
jgi:hypothetical protein